MLLHVQPTVGCLLPRKHLSGVAAVRSHVVVKAASLERQTSASTADTDEASPVISAIDRQRGFLLASERLEQLLEEAYLR